jgi:hypothetical protein
LDVDTGSKRDVVGVVVRNIVVEGDKVTLGDDEMGTEYWNQFGLRPWSYGIASGF